MLFRSKLIEDVKRAAVLYDHLEMIMEHSSDERLQRLRTQKKELEEIMQRILTSDGDDAADDIHISEFDTDQLRNMLSGQAANERIPFAKLLRVLIRKVRNWLRQRRERRHSKVFEGRKLKRY